MTPQVRVLPAADRDIDGQAAYLLQEANLETALRLRRGGRYLPEPCPNAWPGPTARIVEPPPC